MLKTHEKFKLPDKAGRHYFIAEVNWDKEDNKTSECKVVKLICPDGKEAFVEKKHLIEMLFAIGTREEQRNMIPQRITRTRWYETTLGITAMKDIRKGDKIVIPIKLSLPTIEEEIIGEITHKKIQGSKLVTPLGKDIPLIKTPSVNT